MFLKALSLSLLTLFACGQGRPSDPRSQLQSERIAVELTVEGRPIRLELQRNPGIAGAGYREYRFSGGRMTEVTPSGDPARCLYQGKATRLDGAVSGSAWAAVSTCEGLTGFLALDGVVFALEPGEAAEEVLVSRADRERRTPVQRSRMTTVPLPAGSIDRALTAPGKFVELTLVSDSATFAALGIGAAAHALALANIADSLYRNGDLGASLALVVTANVIITDLADPWPIVPDGSEVSVTDLLENFGAWARTNAPAADEKFLLSGLDFAGATVGLAAVGEVCVEGLNKGMVQANHGQAFDGTVLAHELGHGLGMQHDGFGNSCGSSFIMSPAANLSAPATRWSSCSATYLADYLRLLASPYRVNCLDDLPAGAVAPRCGDGVVQAGEQCDCGDADCSVSDPCCDGATCQLVAGAHCSNLDPCCSACGIVTDGRQCRAGGSCSAPAVCDGIGPGCAPNTPAPNGSACDDGIAGSGARCFEGSCRSASGQCQFIVDPSFQSCAPAGSCGALRCQSPGGSCLTVGSESIADGISCGDGLQCYRGTCQASSGLPRCPGDLAGNACGGCGTLASAPGAACNVCGTLSCASPNSLACSVADPSACYHWVAGDFGACSAACGAGVQVRTVVCQDTAGQAVADALCAGAGPKPASEQSCVGTGPCHCADGVKNADERNADCGGADCGACTGERCTTGADCASGVCKLHHGGAFGTCSEATCHDGVKNGREAGVDCGGHCPNACPP